MMTLHCFTCHGPDDATREAGLRLDQQAGALAVLDSGERAIVPGHPEQSELFICVTSDDESTRMPPSESPHALTAGQFETLRRWIGHGAPFSEHWAFQPPQRHAAPEVNNTAWPRGEIDRFVLAQLEQLGITPSEEADRRTLIRRLSLDLVFSTISKPTLPPLRVLAKRKPIPRRSICSKHSCPSLRLLRSSAKTLKRNCWYHF